MGPRLSYTREEKRKRVWRKEERLPPVSRQKEGKKVLRLEQKRTGIKVVRERNEMDNGEIPAPLRRRTRGKKKKKKKRGGRSLLDLPRIPRQKEEEKEEKENRKLEKGKNCA